MGRMLNIKYFLITLFITVAINAFTQSSEESFDSYTMGEGLSHNTVTCQFQDSHGFLWVGTQSGLNKYDGRSFKVYKNEPLDPKSLSNNYINGICEDALHNIWIATEYGLNRFDRSTGKFETWFAQDQEANSLSDNYVYSVYADSKGYIWIKTLRYLDRYDPKSKKFRHFEHYFDLFNPIAENCRFPLFEDSDGGMWVGTNDGLCFFDRQYEQFIRFSHDDMAHKSISNNEIRCIFEDESHNLWVGTSNGLNKFNPKRRTFDAYYYKDSTKPNIINSIVQDASSQLWLATESDGLLRFNLKNKHFSFYTHNPNNSRSILSNNCNTLYKDYSNILWIGGRAGLNKMDIKTKKFTLYRRNYQPNFTFSGNDITSIFADNEVIYVGTRSEGLNIFNRATEKNTIITAAHNQLPGNSIGVILKTSRGEILIGTSHGIVWYNQHTTKMSLFPMKEDCRNAQLLYDKRIKTIFEDTKSNLWIGTNQGLYYFNRVLGEIQVFYHNYNDNSTISSNDINAICETPDGNIWIGTEHGLNRYEASANMFERTEYEKNSNRGLSHNTVYSMVSDDEGNLWIGTGAGLNKYDARRGLFTYFSEKDGLPNNQIFCIVRDQKTLWLSTNKGLARLDIHGRRSDSLHEEVIRGYDVADGLQGYQFNPGCGIRSAHGEMFFGGVNGFNSFMPDSIRNNQVIPKIAITSLKVYNNEGNFDYYLEGKKEIVLPYKNHTFTIEFAALEFTQPKQNSYQYMMEGLDKEWINIENRNFANFSNIPPGEYVFHLRGSNNDQLWNKQGASIKIIIETPIWRNKWAYIIYLLTIALIFYLYIELRTRALRKANKILYEKQQAATELAKQKDELAIKNKNITDSINYAKRIQTAIMPSRSKFKRLLPESFILYLPKDIVSGDFYWVTEIDDLIFIASVDCTGHGVPGAFMSIIGYDLLRNITKERGIHKPSEVLDHLHRGLIDLLTKNMAMGEVKDGMDLCLCVLHKSKGIIEFAGALNPLYLIRNNKIMTIKGDRFPVGLGNENPDEHFKNHIIKLQKGDKVYIFSDGYADQFGGPNGKKMKYRRFRHLLLSIHNMPFEKQCDYLDEYLTTWRGNIEQIDDVLIMGIGFDNYLAQMESNVEADENDDLAELVENENDD